MTGQTTNLNGPALRIPRQAPPVHRGPYAGVLIGGSGIEADTIFDDIGAAFESFVDTLGGVIDDVETLIEAHPEVLALAAAVLV